MKLSLIAFTVIATLTTGTAFACSIGSASELIERDQADDRQRQQNRRVEVTLADT